MDEYDEWLRRLDLHEFMPSKERGAISDRGYRLVGDIDALIASDSAREREIERLNARITELEAENEQLRRLHEHAWRIIDEDRYARHIQRLEMEVEHLLGWIKVSRTGRCRHGAFICSECGPLDFGEPIFEDELYG